MDETKDEMKVCLELRLGYVPATGALWRLDSEGNPLRELITYVMGRFLPSAMSIGNGKRKQSTHTMFYIMEGRWRSPGNVTDHINREVPDMYWGNLREATPAQNVWNSNRQSRRWNSRDQLLEAGVTQTRLGSYVVTLGRLRYGIYQSRTEANQLARRARRELYGEFALAPVTWRRYWQSAPSILNQ
jgi:hypothetical protein